MYEPYSPDKLGLKHGKSRHTPFKFVREEYATSRLKL